MKTTKTPELLGICLVIAAIGATFGASDTFAAGAATTTSSAEARYQQDRADCLAGKTGESQATCLKEAGAALQARREHDLKGGDVSQLQANERKRCDPLTGDDKKACLARVDGLGTTTGSVAGGGELHEIVTTERAAVPGAVIDNAKPPMPAPVPANP